MLVLWLAATATAGNKGVPPLSPPLTVTASVDTSSSAFSVDDGGVEAGLMMNTNCLGGGTDHSCPFGQPAFRLRLRDLGRGGGNAMRFGGGSQVARGESVQLSADVLLHLKSERAQ
jgi:hypothetical protein